MKILIVYVHPKPDGFCRLLLNSAITALEDAGHSIEIADLYREGFSPVLIAEDYNQFKGEPMPAEILREQERVDRNDALIVISPIWWYQFPAMFKGWIDRVFSEGWAFGDSRVRNSEKALRLRKVLVLASAGGRSSTYQKYGYDQAISSLWDTGIWGYCGIEVLTRFFWEIQPREMLDEDFDQYLNAAKELVREFVDALGKH